MHRIDTTNAVPNLFGAGKSGFGPGNPATNQPATFLDDEWCNALQEEFAAIVEERFPLDKSDRGQVLKALKEMFLTSGSFGGTNQSRTINGWQRIPGGLIIQWGRLDGYEYQATPALGQTADWVGSFPIAFPTACLSLGLSAGELPGSNENVEHQYAINYFNETAFGVRVMRLFGSSSGFGDLFGCRYLAIGH